MTIRFRFLFLAMTWLHWQAASAAKTAEFEIEGDHQTIAASAETELRDSIHELRLGGELSHCKIIGQQIDLNGHGRKRDFVATTAEACGWGNAKGPIWLLQHTSTGWRVVLSTTGYSLRVHARRSKDPRDVTISAATAGWHESGTWVFRYNVYINAARPKLEMR